MSNIPYSERYDDLGMMRPEYNRYNNAINEFNNQVERELIGYSTICEPPVPRYKINTIHPIEYYFNKYNIDISTEPYKSWHNCTHALIYSDINFNNSELTEHKCWFCHTVLDVKEDDLEAIKYRVEETR